MNENNSILRGGSEIMNYLKTKKDLMYSFIMQICMFVSLLIGWFIGFNAQTLGYYICGAIYIIALTLYFILEMKNKKMDIVSMIIALSTGILIGTFVSRYSKDYMLVVLIILCFCVVSLIVHLLLLLIPLKKITLSLIIIFMFISIIYCFTEHNDIIYKEIGFVATNYFFTLIGLLIYLFKKKNMDIYYAGSLFLGFIAIVIIIIIILSDGDAADGLSITDFSTSKSEKNEDISKMNMKSKVKKRKKI